MLSKGQKQLHGSYTKLKANIKEAIVSLNQRVFFYDTIDTNTLLLVHDELKFSSTSFPSFSIFFSFFLFFFFHYRKRFSERKFCLQKTKPVGPFNGYTFDLGYSFNCDPTCSTIFPGFGKKYVILRSHTNC